MFQAEDGIRDTSVTGVQTCTLPIFPAARRDVECSGHVSVHYYHRVPAAGTILRSEERRVGKECRSSWRAWTHTNKPIPTTTGCPAIPRTSARNATLCDRRESYGPSD